MPFEVGWLVENRVILTRYTGVIAVDDIHEQMGQTKSLMLQGTPLIHSIIDLSQIEKWPPLNVVNEFRTTEIGDVRLKMGWSIIVADNMLLKFGTSLFTPIFKLRQRVFSTLDEALTFLQGEDHTLPPLKK